MTTFSLSRPQRRKRVFAKSAPPFPIPVESQTSQPSGGEWWYYTAHIEDGCIFVHHTGDMEQLYRLGFFGKGTLSRHQPRFGYGPAIHRTDPETGRQSTLKVTSRRHYLRHLAWSTPNDDKADEDEEPQLPLKKRQSRTDQTPTHQIDSAVEDADKRTCSKDIRESAHSSQESAQSSQNTDNVTTQDENSWTRNSSENQAATDPWSMDNTDKKEDDPWAMDTGDTNQNDPWAMDSVENKQNDPWADSASQETGKDAWAESTDAETADFWGTEQVAESTEEKQQSCVDSTQTLDKKTENSEQTYKTLSPVVELLESEPTQESKNLSETKETKHEKCDSPKPKDTKPDTKVLDPRCLTEDTDADWLVRDDTDDSDIDEAMDTRKAWQPVAKKNPYQSKESLQLSMEEAFFLSYALGCLVIYDENKAPLDLLSLWQRFRTRDPGFLWRYAVYHNLRAKGWVPKSGLKYGSDFVVYQQGPAFYHSTYSVFIQRVSSADLTPMHDGIRRGQTWTELAAINRMTEQVSKEVMLCYIIVPEDFPADAKNSPSCLAQLKIQEVVLRRWVSKQERENMEYYLIP